ncbi:MAG: protein jag [Clostridia bacterium]|nr:protein jag [Clostridia bacterium]
MSKVIISEGKTTNEAIEKGLKELNTSKDKVEIKILEQEKRSFFDILAPRVVKVEITLKEEKNKEPINNVSEQDIELIKDKIEQFLKQFIEEVDKSFNYEIYSENSNIIININGEKSGILIGYRGETLNSLQTILTTIANKNSNSKVRVHLNINKYKEKREKALEDLAIKVSKTVMKTNKKITLEPMNAYERKVIHTKLQNVKDIKTYSIGEEPNRRIVIEKINKK